MVTVDMSTSRAQITKRQRRMRRAEQRRLKRQHTTHLRELRAADAARRARRKAVATWNAEEDRLQRLRESKNKNSGQQNANGTTPPEKSRLVKFASQVWVTEIPTRDADNLPKPFTSPIGVSVCSPTDDHDTDSDDDSSKTAGSPSVTFAQLPEGAFGDDDDDPEFAPDNPELLSVRMKPIQRPRRRIVAKRLDVPLDQIIPAEDTNNESNFIPSPKRPRPARKTQTSKPSSPIHKLHGPDTSQTNGKHLGGDIPSERQEQASECDASADISPPARLKKKRKRSHKADVDIPVESKQETSDAILVSTNKPNCTSNTSDQQIDFSKTENNTQHRSESGTSGEKGERHSPRFSSVSFSDKGLSSSTQNGHAMKSLKHEEPSSLSTANSHSKQNGLKVNGLRHIKLPEKQETEAGVTNDDKELDDMFGDLVKKKAANRADKEKMARKEKRARQESGEKVCDNPSKKFKNGPTRYTEDGLRIMTYDEIAEDQPKGLNGDCPFDCSCCF